MERGLGMLNTTRVGGTQSRSHALQRCRLSKFTITYLPYTLNEQCLEWDMFLVLNAAASKGLGNNFQRVA